MQRHSRWILSGLALLVVTSAAAQMSPEERAVRMAYTKLIFAVENGVILRESNRNQSRIARHEEQLASPSVLANVEKLRLTFELSNFRVGNISELKNVTYEEMASKPTNDPGIAIGGHGQTYRNGSEEREQEAADASWNSWVSSQEPVDWSVPALSIIDKVEHREWYSRYATYDVTVRFDGKSRSYHASALFGSDGSEPKQLNLDMITGVRNLHDEPPGKYYPWVLLAARWRSRPGVEDWLRTHASDGCPSTQVCCEPAAMKCFISKNDIEQPPQPPVPPRKTGSW